MDASSLESGGARRGLRARRLNLGLCLAAGFVWLCFALERLSPVRFALADRVVPAGLGVLFFAIPCGLATLAWLRRGPRAPLAAAQRCGRAASFIFLVLTWVPAAGLAVTVAALVPLWPLTLREGPDSAFAREGFRRLFGQDPPATVQGLYYRVDGPRDPTFFLRCEGVERGLVEQAARRLRLEAGHLSRSDRRSGRARALLVAR